MLPANYITRILKKKHFSFLPEPLELIIYYSLIDSIIYKNKKKNKKLYLGNILKTHIGLQQFLIFKETSIRRWFKKLYFCVMYKRLVLLRRTNIKKFHLPQFSKLEFTFYDKSGTKKNLNIIFKFSLQPLEVQLNTKN